MLLKLALEDNQETLLMTVLTEVEIFASTSVQELLATPTIINTIRGQKLANPNTENKHLNEAEFI